MICYDRQLPEPARILRVKDASVIFNPSATNNFAARWNTPLLQTRAYENKCYVVSVNHAFPRLCGLSLVTDPNGRVVKRLPPWQTVRVVTLDLDLVARKQKALLTRRPSTYQALLRAPDPSTL
jgi:predicted amidohydrolase